MREEEIYKRRLKKVQGVLRSKPHASALLLSSAPVKMRSRDVEYPYRQDSDFFYLTGTDAKDLVLLISAAKLHPIIFAPRSDSTRTIWVGREPNYRLIAESLSAELVRYDDVERSVLPHLDETELLFYGNTTQSLSWNIVKPLLERSSMDRKSMPADFAHSDVLLGTLRSRKDAHEIRLIKEAAEITSQVLFQIIPKIKSGQLEHQLATELEYHFRLNGGCPAFPSIVAAGRSAATLHYEALSRRMQRGEMLLVDCGTEQSMYAADISRVFPIGGSFSPVQRELYSIVLEAQRAAISKVRPGVYIEKVFDAAVAVLVDGLKQLKVLRGSAADLVRHRSYKPYFPHRIGHELGLDVHDLGRLAPPGVGILEANMVLTIEPGLYFRQAFGKIPACGIRIEDDVLVTTKGPTILTSSFPKEISEIESLMSSS